MNTEQIKEYLTQGEDMYARQMLCDKMYEIISQSEKGEIALADFVDQMEYIAQKGRELMDFTQKINLK
jgi:hypothetical protein